MKRFKRDIGLIKCILMYLSEDNFEFEGLSDPQCEYNFWLLKKEGFVESVPVDTGKREKVPSVYLAGHPTCYRTKKYLKIHGF